MRDRTFGSALGKLIIQKRKSMGLTQTQLAEDAFGTAAKTRRISEFDRAYSEARNLIDAIARQFEHSNPNATLADLDEFLRAKAKEWAASGADNFT